MKLLIMQFPPISCHIIPQSMSNCCTFHIVVHLCACQVRHLFYTDDSQLRIRRILESYSLFKRELYRDLLM
jgi:hypothetical protein